MLFYSLDLVEAQLSEFAEGQRDRGARIRPHGCVRLELIYPSGTGRMLCCGTTPYPNEIC